VHWTAYVCVRTHATRRCGRVCYAHPLATSCSASEVKNHDQRKNYPSFLGRGFAGEWFLDWTDPSAKILSQQFRYGNRWPTRVSSALRLERMTRVKLRAALFFSRLAKGGRLDYLSSILVSHHRDYPVNVSLLFSRFQPLKRASFQTSFPRL